MKYRVAVLVVSLLAQTAAGQATPVSPVPREAVSPLVLVSAAGMRRACLRRGNRAKLFAVESRALRFLPYSEEEQALAIDTRRNLRLFRGAVELFPAELETIRFVASAERARELSERARVLRLAFFLGFDREHQACVVRSAGVTSVRAELAFFELLDEDGRVIAREDTERLTAWADDRRVPGAGARAVIESLTPDNAVSAADQLLVSETLRECHRQACTGADCSSVFSARFRVVSGRSTDLVAEVTDLELPERQCAEAAIAALRFRTGPPREGRITVRFEND